MIIFIFNKIIECAVDGVVLAGLDFNRNGGKAVVVIDQIVYFTLITIIVVEQLMPMCCKFTCDDTFINRAEIDASFIVKDRTDVIAVEGAGQNPDIVKIQLQKILAA